MTTEPTPDRERAGAVALARLRSELQTPPRLRGRVEAARSRRARSWRIPALAGAATAAVTAAVVAFVLVGSSPTVEQVAELAGAPATQPPPTTSPVDSALLAGGFEGLAHPDWEAEFGWSASGERNDELEGRPARTVFYDKGAGRIAYTIVGGESLDVPADADITEVDGVEFAALEGDGRNVVTWNREGRTCVLAGDVDRETLIELAAWRGDGAVAF